MKILGIETSCDETGVAVYASGRGIVAESLASQAALHAPYGGVVPELASRDHVARLAPMVRDVLARSDTALEELGAVAYTAGPGLIGALMVGGSFAASLGFGLGIAAVPIHHMEGHLLAPMLEHGDLDFPFLALLVSGGHTQLVEAAALGRYRTIGATLDDAAGEAFDKVARMLALPYPGGPALARLATQGDPTRFDFPRPLRGKGLDFSFSGLKTAVRLAVAAASERTAAEGLGERERADIAASFEAAVVDSLVDKCRRGLEQTGLARLVVAGGVGANRSLRRALASLGSEIGVDVSFPPPELCTDNGSMIAFAGWCRRATAATGPGLELKPRWPLDDLRPPA